MAVLLNIHEGQTYRYMNLALNIYGVCPEGQSLLCSFYGFSSVAQSCLTLCDPKDYSTPGLPVHHQLLEFTQTHVHRVSDAILPSHPLSSPSPPAPTPSQHQSPFQWVSSLHHVAKVSEFQLQHQSFQWIFRTDFLQDGLVGSPCSPRDSLESSPRPHFKTIKYLALSFLYMPFNSYISVIQKFSRTLLQIHSIQCFIAHSKIQLAEDSWTKKHKQ